MSKVDNLNKQWVELYREYVATGRTNEEIAEELKQLDDEIAKLSKRNEDKQEEHETCGS